jgi:UPF0716 protein FxsA
VIAVLLVVLFIGLPALELWVLWQVGGELGVVPTLGILLAVSVLGAWMVRSEGWRAWTRLQRTLGEGRVPGKELIDGGLILVGGALLLTPGFVTDLIGLACVLGPTRAVLNAVVRRRLEARAGAVATRMVRRAAPRGRPPADDDVVDVEVLGIERHGRGGGPPA